MDVTRKNTDRCVRNLFRRALYHKPVIVKRFNLDLDFLRNAHAHEPHLGERVERRARDVALQRLLDDSLRLRGAELARRLQSAGANRYVTGFSKQNSSSFVNCILPQTEAQI